jgi:TetR/AcrR family transcriptional regulator
MAMKKRDPGLTIKALITAAEVLFTQKGYYPVTIKELGEKAGCSPALISYYFGGKKDLYRAVVDRQLAIIDDLKQETKETSLDSLQKIHYFLKALLRTQLDPSGHLDLCYKELIMPSGLLDDTVWQRILSMESYLRSLFQTAAEEGLLKAFSDERTLFHIIFTVESITETLYLVKDRSTPLNPDQRPAEEILDELIDFVITPMKRAERSPQL